MPRPRSARLKPEALTSEGERISGASHHDSHLAGHQHADTLKDLAFILERQTRLGTRAPDLLQRVHRLRHPYGVKRLTDVVLASLALIVLLPLLVGVAFAIRRTSPGPAFFRQRRLGLDGTTFEILKFRTLYLEQTDHSGRRQTMPRDPRVTPLGRTLRRWNIDELPQLINVLRGDMSLVGPRPHVPGMIAGGRRYEKLVPYYAARLCIRPGLTGLAQVNGLRGLTVDADAARSRIDCDIAYIAEWSPLLDFRLLWQTVKAECRDGRGI
ncbi:MAG: sugar transferase [Hyphomicrobium sp.]